MAEEQDDASKTEDPTSKRLGDARGKGHVPVSTEVKHWFMLLGTAFVLATMSGGMADQFVRTVKPFFELAHQIPLDRGGISSALTRAVTDAALMLALPLLVLVIAGISASYLQNGWIWSTTPLAWSLKKLNPINGWKRIFSVAGLVEFLKSIVKVSILGCLLTVILWPRLRKPDAFTDMPVEALLWEVLDISLWILYAVIGAQTVIAAADYFYQKWKYMKEMRMTKQEVKDEWKQAEGSPEVKSKLRSLRMERARRRMMAAVPTADVVITNPTHYAVALKYDPAAMAAPKLVAKGTDLVAKRIRELATENDVPVVENPPVARALYATVEIEQEIPPEQYRAVAEIISFVFKLKRKTVNSGR